MRIEKRKINDTCIIAASGQVNLDTAPDLRAAILEDLTKVDVPKVVLDLTEVTYLDSSGLAVLVEAVRTARDRNTRLALCGLSKEARGLLELTRLLDLFELYSTREEALLALA